MKVLDPSASHAEFIDEVINVPNSNAINVVHDVFFNSVARPFEIYTQAGEGGTRLVETTDYVIGNAYTGAETVALVAPETPYQTVSIVNATYHNTDLYLRYYPIVDLGNSEKWNNDIPWLEISATDDFTFQKRREYRYNKLFLTFTRQATTKTITLPDPTDDFWRGVEIAINIEGSGAGNVTTQGPNSDVIHGPGNEWNATSLTHNGVGTIIIKPNGTDFDVISTGIWDSRDNGSTGFQKYANRRMFQWVKEQVLTTNPQTFTYDLTFTNDPTFALSVRRAGSAVYTQLHNRSSSAAFRSSMIVNTNNTDGSTAGFLELWGSW